MPHLPQPVRSFARIITTVARRARKVLPMAKGPARISTPSKTAVAISKPADSAPVEMLAAEPSEG